jgi:hypothetical protein
MLPSVCFAYSTYALPLPLLEGPQTHELEPRERPPHKYLTGITSERCEVAGSEGPRIKHYGCFHMEDRNSKITCTGGL